jgi:hypothetical protein
VGEPLNIFISYAHEDSAQREELSKILKPMERDGLVNSWHDRMINAGEKWKDRIDEEIERADIVLLLVSRDFIASDYCHEIEMRRALERENDGRADVIAIILRECDLEGVKFSHLQHLPSAKPILSQENVDKAWAEVSKGIRDVVQKRLNPSTTRIVGEGRVKQCLLHKCDRGDQTTQFNRLVRAHLQSERKHFPMVCLIHGNPEDDHDLITFRLENEYLRSKLLNNPARGVGIKTIDWIERPAASMPQNDFWTNLIDHHLDAHLGIPDGMNNEEERQSCIKERLRISPGHLIIRMTYHEREFGNRLASSIENLMKFWEDWPERRNGAATICLLSLIRTSTAPPNTINGLASRLVGRLASWNRQHVTAEDVLTGLSTSDQLAVLERLKPIEQYDAERWCGYYPSPEKEELKLKVEKLYRAQGSRPVSMQLLRTHLGL